MARRASKEWKVWSKEKMRAAIYARFSTDKQRDASIEDQNRECERVAKASGFEVVARFADKGISGGTHQRPGYQAMAEAARGELFDVIISEDISRLWRNRKEYGNRSTEFEDNGKHVVTCVGDDARRDGWMIVTIKLAMAEQQRKEASYRTRRGLEGNARRQVNRRPCVWLCGRTRQFHRSDCD
jgi:site-specific DNA recombinase